MTHLLDVNALLASASRRTYWCKSPHESDSPHEIATLTETPCLNRGLKHKMIERGRRMHAPAILCKNQVRLITAIHEKPFTKAFVQWRGANLLERPSPGVLMLRRKDRT